MTRLTAMWIRNNEDVYAGAVGPDEHGRYGIYIGSYDESPSGLKRPRALLTSETIYATPNDAVAAGNEIIRQVREQPEEP